MVHRDLTTSRHLVQSPQFRAVGGLWHDNFDKALPAGASVTWDVAALLSIPYFTYACADRTLFTEITRQPWLSHAAHDGTAKLEPIPPHELCWMEQSRIADELRVRLERELSTVCRDRSRIYLLLSGGLDSRILAGALSELHRRGELACSPIAVTWGLNDSRDYEYSREVARLLGFEWIHVSLKPEDLLDNIEATAVYRGCLVPPNYLHRVLWFRDVEPDALVLAGSYGDMVGRGEFSGRTILELERHSVNDPHGLLKSEFAAAGIAAFSDDVSAFRRRAFGQHEYVYCEREQHGFYTRGSLAMALSVVGQFCDVYQAFTDPAVYGFMWSLHPALRNDEPYARLLERYDARLARLPWARTNRALAGPTAGAKRGLRRAYHEYAAWARGPLYSQLRELVDPRWFAAMNVFDTSAIKRIEAHLIAGTSPSGSTEQGVAWIYLWLASVRLMVDRMTARGQSVYPPPVETSVGGRVADIAPPSKTSFAKLWLRKRPALRRWLKQLRAGRLRRASVRLYPPTSTHDETA